MTYTFVTTETFFPCFAYQLSAKFYLLGPEFIMSNTSETPMNGGQSLMNHHNESDQSNHPSVIWVKANKNTGITKLNDHLTDTNYNTWKGQMMLTLEICGVEQYVRGTEEKPNADVD